MNDPLIHVTETCPHCAARVNFALPQLNGVNLQTCPACSGVVQFNINIADGVVQMVLPSNTH